MQIKKDNLNKSKTYMPLGWTLVLVSDIVQNIATIDPTKKPNQAITYFDISSIDNEAGVVVHSKALLGCDAPSRARQIVCAGDVLFSTVRPNLRAIAAVPDLPNGVASTGFCVLRAERGINSKFLYFFARSDCFLDQVLPHQRGVSYPAVRSIDVVSQSMPLPPSAEQTRIVAKLEELLSSLDAGVAELKAAQKKLVQYRQSLLKAAVEGTLTKAWRDATPASETGSALLARILKERRARWEAKQLAKFEATGKAPHKDWQKKYPEPAKPDTTGLAKLPEGWVWASLDMLLSGIETGKSFKCEERPPEHGQVGVVKVSAVSWGEYDEMKSKTCHDDDRLNESLYVKEGDFLFSRANTIELIGACVIAKLVSKPIMLSDKILRFVLIEDAMKHWLLSFLRSEFGRSQIENFSSGNQDSMRNIGQAQIKKIVIPIPSFEEIHIAIDQLALSLVAADEQTTAITHSLKQSAAQRKNILQAAFAGRLVAQDPNDEPAGVLLARIAKERVSSSKQKSRGKA